MSMVYRNFANIYKAFIFEVLSYIFILPVAVVRKCCHISVVVFSVGIVIFSVAVVTLALSVADVLPETEHKERASGVSIISESPRFQAVLPF